MTKLVAKAVRTITTRQRSRSRQIQARTNALRKKMSATKGKRDSVAIIRAIREEVRQ